MPGYEGIESYLQAVEGQIRWKRARPAVSLELRRHLEDQRDALLREGHAAEEAESLAVAEMGDPVAVGIELDRIHRPKPQWGPLALTLALALSGGLLRVLLTAGSSSAVSPARTLSALLLGTLCLLGGYFLDCSRLLSYPRTFYAAALTAGVLSLWLSPTLHGIRYYTRYVVLLYPTVYAVWLHGCRGKGKRGLLAAVAGGIPLAAVCLLAPSTLGLLALLLCGFILLMCAILSDWFSLPRKQAVTAVCAAALVPTAGLTAYVCAHPHRMQRLVFFLHPEQDPMGSGYQALSVRKALAASRWLGTGSTQGLPATYERFVPEWSRDSLLTTIIYRLGWLPFLALVLAAAGLTLWLLIKCLRRKKQPDGLLALSVVLSLSIQAAASLCMNLGFPALAAEFPLLIGNLHTVIDMGLIGLALSVFRGSSVPCLAAEKQAG